MDDTDPPMIPLTQVCSSCGTLIDVSQEEPLANIHCPSCGAGMKVERNYNHFRIVELLGRGGMGAVYRAEDMRLHRLVALKILRLDVGQQGEHREQLEQEARITASINHPYVVKVFTFGEAHGQFYLAMELVDKGSLDDLMQLQSRVAEMQVLEVGTQIAQGLRAAWEVGLIHRDVKPGNILFADAHTAKIVDFGLALLMEKEAEARGEVWGTPYYIAPEKLDNQPEDFRSDMYSLGASLFHAVAGRPPFEAESASLVALKHLKSRAVSLQAFAPDVSSETAFVINRMLERNPEERYGSYDELIEHLEFAKHALQEKMRDPKRMNRQRVEVETHTSRRILGVLTLFTLLMIGAAVLYFGYWLINEQQPRTVASRPAGGAGLVLTVGDFREGLPDLEREKFAEALRLARGGRFQQARGIFLDLLEQEPPPAQPGRNWYRLLGATSALFVGDRALAYQWLGQVSREALFSNAPENKTLADFFRRAGNLVSEPGITTVEEVEKYQTTDGQGLLILLAGLNNWQSGFLQEGTGVLRLFLETETDGELAWINDFHAPVEGMLETHAQILQLEKEAEEAMELEALRGVSRRLERIVEEMDEGDVLRVEAGKVQRFIETRERVLTEQARREEERRRLEEERIAEEERQRSLETADRAVWDRVHDRVGELIRAFAFQEAQGALLAVDFASDRYQEMHGEAVRRVGMLERYLRFVILRVGMEPYPHPVVTRGGSRYAEGVDGFRDGKFLSTTPYGQLEIALNDLDPAMILEIGLYLSAAISPGEREEVRMQAALFALEMGLPEQASVLFAEYESAAQPPEPLFGQTEVIER